MKRFIPVILATLLAIAGIVGTVYFYMQNENQIAQNAQLVTQNSAIQSELNAIGTMGTVYEVATRVYSGKEIKDTDLIAVSIPVSAMGESTIRDMSELVGKSYKVDINPGTILTKDLLMEEENSLLVKKYTRELALTALPLGLIEGDYIDIRMLLPNGEEYVVFSHLKVDKIVDKIISFKVSEEENYIVLSMLQDLANYVGSTTFYATRYLNPGKDTDTVAMYPVQHEMENWILFNPNITDTTRCINSSLRDHIDEVLIRYTTGDNAGIASSFIQGVNAQISAGGTMHESWVDENTDEEGNFTGSNYGTEDGSGNGGNNFQQQVGDAMGNLEDNLGELGDMEAIN